MCVCLQEYTCMYVSVRAYVHICDCSFLSVCVLSLLPSTMMSAWSVNNNNKKKKRVFFLQSSDGRVPVGVMCTTSSVHTLYCWGYLLDIGCFFTKKPDPSLSKAWQWMLASKPFKACVSHYQPLESTS